jgi:hypothetical protein
LSFASSNSAASRDALAAAGCEQGSLVDEVGKVRAGEAGRAARDGFRLDIFRERHIAHVDFEDFLAADDVRIADGDLAVKTAGTQQRRVEHVRTVRRRHDDDAFVGFEAVHLDEQLVQRLLALVIAAAEAGAARAADGIDLVDEDDAGRGALRLFEHVAHAACADADEHFDEVRTGDGEEGHAGFACDRAGEQRLTRARRADEQRAFRDLAAEALELGRVLQELDDLLQLFLGFIDAGDVIERDAAMRSVRRRARDLPKLIAPRVPPPCIWRIMKKTKATISTIGSSESSTEATLLRPTSASTLKGTLLSRSTCSVVMSSWRISDDQLLAIGRGDHKLGVAERRVGQLALLSHGVDFGQPCRLGARDFGVAPHHHGHPDHQKGERAPDGKVTNVHGRSRTVETVLSVKIGVKPCKNDSFNAARRQFLRRIDKKPRHGSNTCGQNPWPQRAAMPLAGSAERRNPRA